MRVWLAEMLRAAADRLDPVPVVRRLQASLERFERQMDRARERSSAALREREEWLQTRLAERDAARPKPDIDLSRAIRGVIGDGRLDEVMADRFGLSPVAAPDETNGGGDA